VPLDLAIGWFDCGAHGWLLLNLSGTLPHGQQRRPPSTGDVVNGRAGGEYDPCRRRPAVCVSCAQLAPLAPAASKGLTAGGLKHRVPRAAGDLRAEHSLLLSEVGSDAAVTLRRAATVSLLAFSG